MKKIVVIFHQLLAVTLLCCLLACNQQQKESSKKYENYTINEEGYKETTVEDFNFQWKINEGNIDIVHIKLSAPTTGWLALGIRPSGMIKNANFIIGYMKNGNLSIRDCYGTSPVSYKTDKELGRMSSIMKARGSQNKGKTRLSFTIPLKKGDKYDGTLKKGEICEFIFAYGNDEENSYEIKKCATKVVKKFKL